ncbi:phage tail protein [Polaribacter aquimarinus]|uniref:Phage tail protein n=1 Tax=Polaribacter aquimarinus TaxID=2100726 RepID=A0A2U2JBL7_9FLAO|nr:tail fiber protein [Polaribacter aquimarinus]PWG05705.1 phage tail protein [Polaribacter aquimarinus]
MDEYIGIVKIFAGNFAPRNWAFCHGQLLAINQNTALFSILGTTYGGDGRTTFGLPDLRGRAPIGAGNGPGITPIRQGQMLGNDFTTLSTNNLPPHNHIISVSETAGTIDIPVNNEDGSADEANPAAGILANTGADNYSSEASPGQKYGGQSIPVNVSATATASMTGSGNSFSNIQPSLGINYIICLQGLFPPRS